MSIKVIATGNILMGDDGIGVRVGKTIKSFLGDKGVTVIIGETDVNYCMSEVVEEDTIYVIDGIDYELDPGTVIFKPLSEVTIIDYMGYSEHQLSLIKELKITRNFKSVYLIGIQVKDVRFSLTLSDILEEKFVEICKAVLSLIILNIST